MAETGPHGNPDYFVLRESQERKLADQAGDRAARCAHLTMAERYAALASKPGATPTKVAT
jgi:hypothetical protein